jgi:hypothetical protein
MIDFDKLLKVVVNQGASDLSSLLRCRHRLK